jgi:hypothetical protein
MTAGLGETGHEGKRIEACLAILSAPERPDKREAFVE